MVMGSPCLSRRTSSGVRKMEAPSSFPFLLVHSLISCLIGGSPVVVLELEGFDAV
jgi:hypothetical protein